MCCKCCKAGDQAWDQVCLEVRFKTGQTKCLEQNRTTGLNSFMGVQQRASQVSFDFKSIFGALLSSLINIPTILQSSFFSRRLVLKRRFPSKYSFPHNLLPKTDGLSLSLCLRPRKRFQTSFFLRSKNSYCSNLEFAVRTLKCFLYIQKASSSRLLSQK